MNSFAITVSLIALCVVSAFGLDGCSVYKKCEFCTNNGCGWCSASQQCLNGTLAGPTGSTCTGSYWEFGQCTQCASITDCRMCASRDSDCIWCTNNGGACMDLGFSGCTKLNGTCPCNVYSDCSQCTDDATCNWCSVSGLCAPAGAQSCQGEISYNITTGCPCSVNLECPSCRATYGCKWCQSGSCSETCPGQPAAISCNVWCQGAAAGCHECNALEGCSWCADSNTCVDPSTSNCLVRHTCPECTRNTFCDTCLNSDGCLWCEDSGTCEPQGTACLMAHSCSTFCASFTFCESCNAARGCGWCSDSNSCVDATQSQCAFAHSCVPAAPGQCGFSGGSFVGGMALAIVIVLGVAGAIAFYRWKFGANRYAPV